MNLNTYRCGCGRIETLPHAKARPGPCVHKALPDVELTPWRPVDVRMPPGWTVTEALARSHGDEVFLLLARKPGRKDVGLSYAREKAHMRRPALDTLRRICVARQGRAEGFFAALRGIVKFASATFAAPPRPPGHIAVAPPMPPEVVAAIRAGAKVSAPRETPDGRWVCDVERPRLPEKTFDRRELLGGLWNAVEPAPAICRWRTDIEGADRLRYAKAAQMYAEGLHRRGLSAYVLTTQIKGLDAVRVAFDTEEMENAWVAAVDYRLDLVDRIQAATGVALSHLLDVPSKRPSWFPADV